MTKTLNISLPQSLINQVDRLARYRASSRSEFIRNALRASITRSQLLDQTYRIGKKKAKQQKVKSEEDALNLLERQ